MTSRKNSHFWRATAAKPDSGAIDPWVMESLANLLAAEDRDGDSAAATMAEVLAGHVAHPDLAGSALHLLLTGRGGQPVGGLQSLTNSLLAAARAAGAEIVCGLEVTDILRGNGRMRGLRLADGTEISARAVISTLDLKRTLLSLFAWNDLPGAVSSRAASFRMAGGTARLLVALDRLPERPGFSDSDLFAGPIHIAPDLAAFGSAYAAWRSRTLGESLPITLRFISTTDPRMCPPGAATLTATVDGVPAHPFDGSWTQEKRAALRERVLEAIEQVLPGVGSRAKASELLVPPDIEEALGCTDSDLWGGEIAADQMLSFRPGFDIAPPRTPVEGLYLAGPSTAVGVLETCTSGVLAARAVTTDLKIGRLK